MKLRLNVLEGMLLVIPVSPLGLQLRKHMRVPLLCVGSSFLARSVEEPLVVLAMHHDRIVESFNGLKGLVNWLGILPLPFLFLGHFHLMISFLLASGKEKDSLTASTIPLHQPLPNPSMYLRPLPLFSFSLVPSTPALRFASLSTHRGLAFMSRRA